MQTSQWVPAFFINLSTVSSGVPCVHVWQKCAHYRWGFTAAKATQIHTSPLDGCAHVCVHGLRAAMIDVLLMRHTHILQGLSELLRTFVFVREVVGSNPACFLLVDYWCWLTTRAYGGCLRGNFFVYLLCFSMLPRQIRKPCMKLQTTHVDRLPFTCTTCARVYGTSRQLHNHAHTHERRHVCAVCALRFAQKADLIRHMVSASEGACVHAHRAHAVQTQRCVEGCMPILCGWVQVHEQCESTHLHKTCHTKFAATIWWNINKMWKIYF